MGRVTDDFLAEIGEHDDGHRANGRARRPRFDEPERPDGRMRIRITADEHLVNDHATKALAGHAGVYQRGGVLVHVVEGEKSEDGIVRPENAPTIRAMKLDTVRETLSARGYFYGVRKRGEEFVEEQQRPPEWCARGVAARGSWTGIPRLVGVTTTPVLRPDGTLLDTRGYDTATGLVYAPVGDVSPVPARPTRDDALRAVETLLDPVCDFPFVSAAHCSTWLAMTITPFARPAFEGPVPMAVVDAPTAGSGKGKLCTLAGVIGTGRGMSVMTNSTDDAEVRKRITTFAADGDTLVLIDNVDGTLGTPSLDAALTADVWKDRVLGENRSIELPLRMTWWATGNNIVLRGDTTRRTAHIRIDPKVERPDERSGFQHADVVAYTIRRRPQLVAAALTILRAYVVAGRPDPKLPTWGSFEAWSGLVRAAVVWAGQPDPAEAREELRRNSDSEAGAMARLFDACLGIDPTGAGLTTAEIRQAALDRPELAEALCELTPPKRGETLPNSRQIGNKLRRIKDRVVEGVYLTNAAETRKGVQRWVVCDAGSAGSIPVLRGRASGEF